MSKELLKDLTKLFNLLLSKAEVMAKKSEANDNNKGFWQAGQAEGLSFAAHHLQLLIDQHKKG